MLIKSSLMLIILLTQLMGCSCSTQSWQHSLQEAGKNECYSLPAEERERCLQRLQQSTKP